MSGPTGGAGNGPDAPPPWVRLACGGPVLAARRSPWGFRHETWTAEVPDGRRVVVQRRADGSDPTTPDARAVRDRVRAAGLVVPEPSGSVRVDGAPIVVLPYLEGEAAAALLAKPGGAAIAGRACGEVAARLAGIDPAGLRLPDTWASGATLRAAAGRWTVELDPPLSTEERDRIAEAAERVAIEVDAQGARLAHGDLAPVNVLVQSGRPVAVLDLDRVRLAHPRYDAAWFAWVVGFHHPDVAGRAIAAFARASDPGGEPPELLARTWPLLLLLERAAEAGDAVERARWSGRLAARLRAGPDGPRPRAV